MSDFSDLISSYATGTYTVSRISAGSSTYVAGRRQAGSTSTFSIPAVVVPLSGMDLQRLPEGFQSQQTIAIYTTVELKTASSDTAQDADQLNYQGQQYQIENVEHWESGNFWKSIAQRIQL